MAFEDFDFGATSMTSSFSQEYNSHFVLYSILNACYFSYYGINKYIIEPAPIKLRIMYLIYYYLNEILFELNSKYNQSWLINDKWKHRDVRNALAHYGLWAVLKENIDNTDIFGGMTEHIFNVSWENLLQELENEILSFCNEIEEYLRFRGIMHKYIFPVQD